MKKRNTWSWQECPKEILRIAHERTRPLIHYWHLNQHSLTTIIESAYIQGIVDAAESLPPGVFGRQDNDRQEAEGAG